MSCGEWIEAWRPIPGFPSYEASDAGRVRRSPRAPGRGACHGRVLTPQPGGGRYGSYLRVSVSEGGVRSTQLVHILVALAWLGPRPSKTHHVDHQDEDTTHNAPHNLRWMPGARNMARGALSRWHGQEPPEVCT